MAQAPAPVKHAELAAKDDTLLMPVADPAVGSKPVQTIGVDGAPIEDGARDPNTIAEEQRRRSDEYVANMAKATAETAKTAKK